MTNITKIISPKSGKVTEIIHIADIHIRNGDEIASRYDEYYKVFTNLFSTLKKLDSVKNNEAVCVICGDTFHAKTKLETPGIKLFLYLLQNLGSILPTFIILGNHDFKQDQMDNSIDFLDAFGHVISENIVFLQETGLYTCANLGIGMVDIKETLRIGSGSGMADKLPDFPDPNEFPEEINKTIALFHGTMVHSKFTDNRTTDEGYPWEWMDVGYNYALLGDIHKQQIFPIRKKTKMMAAYSGSLIQQNYGETLFKHGILVWNLQEDSVKSIDIKNEYGFVKLMNKNNKWLLEKTDLIDSVKNENFPKKLRIRIFGSYNDEQKYELKEMLDDCEYTLDETVIKDDITQTNSSDFSSEGLLEQYMLENNISDYSVPELDELLIQNEPEFNGELKKIVKKKNTDLEKEYSIYAKTLEISDNITKFNIKYLEWAGLLCYSDKNWVDFNLMKNKTNLISAPNGGGKSSYLEIICISIYGKPIPSRSIKGNPIALISKGKGEKDPSYTVVHIEIDEATYRINRIFDKDGKPKSRGGGVFKKNGDEWLTVCIDSPKIKEWVLKNVGNIDEFLMTTLVSQSNDSDFLSMKPVEQRSHLEKLLGLRVANSKANLFKQAFSITKSFKTNLDICLGENSNDSENVDELQAINAIYNAKKSLLKNLSSSLTNSWGNCKIEDLKLNVDNIENRINVYEDYDEIKNNIVYKETKQRELEEVISNMHQPCKKPENNSEYYQNKLELCVHKLEECQIMIDNFDSNCLYTKPLFEKIQIDKIESAIDEETDCVIPSKEVYDDSITKIESYSNKLQKTQLKVKKLSDTIDELETKDDMLYEKVKNIQKERGNSPIIDKDRIIDLIENVEKNRHSEDKKRTLHALYGAQMYYWNQNLMKIEENERNIRRVNTGIKGIEESLKDSPYNPNCAACNQQPLRKQLNSLYVELKTLQDESESLSKVGKNLTQISNTKYEKLSKWIEEFDTNLKLFDKYTQYLDDWNVYDEMCAKCTLVEEERENIRQEIREMKSKNKEYSLRINMLNTDLQEYQQICKNYDSFQCKKNYWDERRAFIASVRAQWLLYDRYVKIVEFSEIYEKYKAKHLQLKNLLDDCDKYAIFIEELNVNKGKVVTIRNEIQTLKDIVKELDYWSNVLNLKSDFDKQRLVELEIESLREEIQILYGSKEVLSHSINQNKKVNEKDRRLREISEIFGNKMDKLNHLGKLFDNYRSWLYEKHILPKLVRRANRFVSNVEPYLSLCYTIQEDGTFSFTAKNEKHEVSLEKASGFEYFILAMSLRLAFMTLTMGDKFGGQFFIDEGFTACDARHLNKIPNFLQSLLEMFDSIILVSHIEHIKDSVDNTIFIRNRSIQHGSTYSFKKPKIVRKKRVNS